MTRHLKDLTMATVSLGPNALRVQSVCPALLDLLGDDLIAVLDNESSSSATDYWKQVHLLFILRILVNRTSSELACAVLEKHKKDERTDLPYGEVTSGELSERLHLFKDLLKSMSLGENHLLDGVALAYKLSKLETLVLQFLVTVNIHSDSILLSLLQGFKERFSAIDTDAVFTPAVIRYVCGASTLELDGILDEDHALCKDRVLILTQDEYGGSPTVQVSNEACRAFLGHALNVEGKLKLAGTKLLALIDSSEANDASSSNSSQPTVPLTDSSNGSPTDFPEYPNPPTGHPTTMAPQADIMDMLQNIDLNGSCSAPPGMNRRSDSCELATGNEAAERLDRDEETLTDAHSSTMERPKQDDVDTKEPRRYTCELDYLKDQFDLVIQKVINSRQRIAQDLRNASVADSRPIWMRSDNTSKVSAGETSAKIRLAQRKIDLSLQLTREEGTFYPRLELLVGQLGLDEFEKSVLVYLAGSMISPVFKSCLQQEGSRALDVRVKVGDLLNVFCSSFPEQVACRTYFYRSSTLVRKGLVKPIVGYLNVSDLTDQDVQLDRRVLDCIVGLDKESTEVSQGSHLYEPKVSLDSVVLPPKLKTDIVNAVAHFDQFRRYRKQHPSFDEAIAYGTGLTLMLSGESGTGKTLTANAIAAKLGKKLLLVNYPNLSDLSNGRSDTSRYQSIFREAELSDCVVFFDECEGLFASRHSGGSFETAELLQELERFEGIAFLATNRPYDLDEAMYRRISEVFEFKRPNYLERLEIWKIVTAHDTIPCEDSIDWESIALQYELTGGFIKNAVIAAMLQAVGRNPASPMITQNDIIDGCKKQVRGALQMMEFDERVIPQASLEELIATEHVKKDLEEMVNLEKARGILFGSWGFNDDMRDRQGTTALFWGPSGTGKSRAAEALGYELAKPLKVVDLPRLLEEKRGRRNGSGGGTLAVRDVFQEARLMDAILVLDGFSLQPDGSGGGATDDTRLLNFIVREMTRFPGVIIMMVETSGSLDVFVSRLDKGLLRGLKFLVEFRRPSLSNRQKLWERLIPSSVPTAEKLDFAGLARSSDDFSQVQIGNAVYRAAASAALRSDSEKRVVSMNDLYKAIEEEKSRGESAVDRYVKSQYM